MTAKGLPSTGAVAAWLSAAGVAAGVVVVGPLVFASWQRLPDFSHGWLLALLAVWAFRAQRARFLEHPRVPQRAGLPLVAAASALFPVAWFVARTFGHRQAVVWILAVSLLAVAAGLVLLEHGWLRLRALAFPFLFLLLAVPPPGTLTTWLTSALQELASVASALALRAVGIAAAREGFVLQLDSGRLHVSEACSGIRSLNTLSTLAIVIAWVSGRGPLAAALLALAAVPLALVGNVARIAATGLVQEKIGRAVAVGTFHELLGVAVVGAGAVALYALSNGLARRPPRAREATPPAPRREPAAPLAALRVAAAACVALAAAATLVADGRAGEDVPAPSLAELPRTVAEGVWVDAPLDGSWATLGHDVAVRRVHLESDRALGIFVGYWGTRLWSGTHDLDMCLPTQGLEILSASQRLIRPRDGGPAVEASYRRSLERGKPASFLFWAQQGRVVLDPHPGLLEWRNVYRLLARPAETRGRLFVLLSLRGEAVEERAVSRLERVASELLQPLYGLCPWARPGEP